MIRICLGAPGSGKTASVVRELAMNKDSKTKTYSNIITTDIKNNVRLKPEMLIKKVEVGKKKDGTPIYKQEFNKEFWKNIIDKKEKINIVIDEAHTLLNPRRAMSNINIIMTDFIAMCRRVLGTKSANDGELTFITQIERRIDPIARELCTNVKYHICHILVECKRCHSIYNINNEIYMDSFCSNCGSKNFKEIDWKIEVFEFYNMEQFTQWKYGDGNFSEHYLLTDIEKYFKYYNTMQWESLFSQY